ncbi:GUN4 domain protein [Gloeothece citriformis PCC 7424]|uniref:GUN4 domain protein n=1 Tax=Gloeothece citriformis (strain PCC 7424) TaxID=65393 RepID=B7K7V9_GLOC7|nr:GUN4 domain-containing protein [Gloeothece citriformis]ACK71155.1 GUN4 domain protein [Gloeothece citriformis PCC 7424]
MKRLFLALALSLVPFIDVTAQPSFQTAPSSRSQQALISPETKVDYSRLQTLLAEGNWRGANDETFLLLLKAANRDKQGWVTIEDVRKLPCWDLQTLDNLWTRYSQGRFGFSTQFQIFVATGNRPGRLAAIENYEKFGDEIGWRKNNDWIQFKENLDYSLNAPIGHLPSPRQEYQLSGARLEYTTLTERMVQCNLVSQPNIQKR